MNKNVYDVFRTVAKKRATCFDTRSAAFITQGKLSKDIYHKRKNKIIKAGLVYRYQEGPDEVMVYTFQNDDLRKGDYFIHDHVNYLVYENQKLVDDNLNHVKQKAVECNVSFNFGEEVYQGYFKSSLRRYNDEEFQGKQVLNPEEKPLLILPKNANLTINSEFIIEGKPWRIIEYDDITNKGITYYYLERGIKTNVVEPIEEIEPLTVSAFSTSVEIPTLNAFDEHSFETVDGVFSSMPKVNIVERTSTLIKFTIPFGVEEITIFTGIEGNVIYKVVE